MIKRLVQTIALSLAAFLAGCGGDDASYATVEVTPVAGKFSSGTVDVFNSTGTKIGSASVNSTTGKATVTLNVGSAPSIMVFRVAGGSYYDEGTGNSSASNDYMLGVVANGASNGSYAVTPLTDMAAAIAGLSGSASTLTVPTTFNSTTINAAISAVPLLLGVDASQLDINSPPTLISASSGFVDASGSARVAKANAYAYLLAAISANAAVANISNNQMIANLRSASVTYYNGGASTGTFTMPTGMLGVDGKLNTANIATVAGSASWYASISTYSANAIGSNTYVPFTSKTSIASAIAAGFTAAQLAVQPGAYCPTYDGRQILDPTDPKNAPYFATATGYMTGGGFRVSKVVSGTAPNDFTIFGAGGTPPDDSTGIYLEYYTVYGLPSWASGAGSGAIFTGTYSGVSGGTDGFALNTLMMSDGYTGTGTFMLTYSGMTTPTPYFLSTTGGSTGALRPVVLTCPNL